LETIPSVWETVEMLNGLMKYDFHFSIAFQCQSHFLLLI
jgi:hypothetical protein